MGNKGRNNDMRHVQAIGDEVWQDDAIQFPRLLCEIVATNSALDLKAVAASMDLELPRVLELLDRAHLAWEEAKRALRRR